MSFAGPPYANQIRTFHCPACQGKISIPADYSSMTAPCPSCGEVITSPAPEGDSVEPDELETVRLRENGEVVILLEETQGEDGEVTLGNRADSFLREGGEKAPILAKSPDSWQLQEPLVESPESRWKQLFGSPIVFVAIPILFLSLLFLVATIGVSFFKERDQSKDSEVVTIEQRDQIAYEEEGWIIEASGLLTQFVKASSPEAQQKLVIGGAKKRKFLQDSYSSEERVPLAISSFAPKKLEVKDHKRGIYLMIYHQPKQYSLKSFFRPVATLEVQYQLEAPDTMLVVNGGLSQFAESSQTVFAFFKKIEGELKLDAETFIQTRDRTFSTFIDEPQLGAEAVFRVLIDESVTSNSKISNTQRYYRLCDPAYQGDAIYLAIQENSQWGQVLQKINWTKEVDRKASSESATVKLAWRKNGLGQPEIVLAEFLSWEFLGLGGTPSNLKE